MLSFWKSPSFEKEFLLARAFSTKLLDIIWTTSTPSIDRSALIFHSNMFFSGWNCTPQKGQFLASTAATKSMLVGVVAWAIRFQKFFRYLLVLKVFMVTAQLWEKKKIPLPLVIFSFWQDEMPLKIAELLAVMLMGFTTCTSPVTLESTSLSSAVKQDSSWKPMQVPQTGKTLPLSFCSFAQFRIASAFLVQRFLMSIQPDPPVKSTPLS